MILYANVECKEWTPSKRRGGKNKKQKQKKKDPVLTGSDPDYLADVSKLECNPAETACGK